MDIIEINGTRYRVKQRQLAQKQTENDPSLAMLHREFDDHPGTGLTPAKLASIMRQAETGDLIAQGQLAEDFEERNTHLHAELYKRKSAVKSVPWRIVPPDDATQAEKQDAANIESYLKDVGLASLLGDMGDAILKGYANIEYAVKEVGITNKMRLPVNFELKPATWFMVNPDNRNELRLRNSTHSGQELRPFSWIKHRHPAKSGYVSRSGLVRQVAWPHLFGNYSIRDLAEFLEVYGIPAKIGKYPTGASPQEKSRLLQAVIMLGHRAAGIIPRGMEIDYKNHAQGNADSFKVMIDWSEAAISKAVLGQTLTAQAGAVGSQALGNVHNEVREDIRDNDLELYSQTINQDLILPTYMLNGKSYRHPMRKPRIVFETQEPEDIKDLSESIPKLVNIGLRVPTHYVHDKLQIPQAKEGEEVLAAQPAPVQDNANPVPSAELSAATQLLLGALKGSKSEVSEQQAPIDQSTDTLGKRAAQLLASMTGAIEKAVDEAESLEALKEKLLELQEEIDESELADVMAEAFAAAELMGRFEVNQESE